MSATSSAPTPARHFPAEPFLVRRAAVLGAGTMGSRIAAHFANARIPTLLLDIVIPGAKVRDQASRNCVEATGGDSHTPLDAMSELPGGGED